MIVTPLTTRHQSGALRLPHPRILPSRKHILPRVPAGRPDPQPILRLKSRQLLDRTSITPASVHYIPFRPTMVLERTANTGMVETGGNGSMVTGIDPDIAVKTQLTGSPMRYWNSRLSGGLSMGLKRAFLYFRCSFVSIDNSYSQVYLEA